jgi:hypothetical protein
LADIKKTRNEGIRSKGVKKKEIKGRNKSEKRERN